MNRGLQLEAGMEDLKKHFQYSGKEVKLFIQSDREFQKLCDDTLKALKQEDYSLASITVIWAEANYSTRRCSNPP